MSGSQITSAFGDPNILYRGISGAGLIANQNALLTQQGMQQDLGTHETEAVARAAGALYSMNEADAAAAYPGMVAGMRAQGFKLANAPATYPGHAAIGALAQRGMTVPEQLQYGMMAPPGLGPDVLRGIYGGGPPGGQQGATQPAATSGGTPGPSGAGVALGMRQNNPGNLAFAGQPNASPGQGNRFASFPDMPTGVAATANQLAINQEQHGIKTVRGQVTRWVSDPAADLNTYIADTAKAIGVGPDDPVDWTDPKVQAAFILAQQPHESGGGGAVLDPAHVQQGVQLAAAQRGRAVQGPQQQAAAGPQAPAGGAATPAPYQVATTGPIPPPPSSGAPVADLVGPRPLPPQPAYGVNAPVVTPQSLANTPTNALAAPEQPPPAQVAQAGPPTALAPPPAAPAQPVPLPPSSQVPANAPGLGVNSPQYQEIQYWNGVLANLERLPGAKFNPDIQSRIAQAKANVALASQTGKWTQLPDGTQVDQLTGERKDEAKPLPTYVWDTQHNAWVDKNAHATPVTPRAPAMIQTPGGDILQGNPGESGANVVYTTDPGRLAAQEAAKAKGAKSGALTAEALPKLIDSGRAAAAAEGNIDYGLSQLDKAKAGGITTGYFSGALTTIQSAAKSLGFPTDKIPFINVDPSAIGNIQTARKTLAVVSGAILQQIIGKSDITDAKIEAFVHAQPGIETDPDAVRRVLAWARSQFTFEREMAQAGVKEAADTGRLATNWQARYFKEHGFAPIYNPMTGEMRQPDGGAPGRESPTTSTAIPAVKSDADFHALPSGAIFTDPNGQQRRKP